MTGILVLCSLEVGSVFPGIAFLHWECVCCNFGEWWQSVLHLGMCLAACGNLTSIEVAVGKDFTTEVVMTWQIMMWEQAQAGDKSDTALSTPFHLCGVSSLKYTYTSNPVAYTHLTLQTKCHV